METKHVGCCRTLLILSVAGLLSGCVGSSTTDNDPLEGVNRAFYNFNDSLDRHIVKPVATGYVKVTPKYLRDRITNFFDNVAYLNVIANDLLQGKLAQAWNDSGRFVINSTVGFGGLWDRAAESGLVQHDEDLGQTFGVWGMGEGAYLVIPLVGPNAVRDAPDLVSSAYLSPLFYLGGIVSWPLGILNAVNKRANLLDATRILHESALDPYSFVREAYRQNREFKIYDGHPPRKMEEDYIDEGETGVLKVY